MLSVYKQSVQCIIHECLDYIEYLVLSVTHGMFLALGTFTHSDNEFKGTFEVMSVDVAKSFK
jgi:hypothetical protein